MTSEQKRLICLILLCERSLCCSGHGMCYRLLLTSSITTPNLIQVEMQHYLNQNTARCKEFCFPLKTFDRSCLWWFAESPPQPADTSVSGFANYLWLGVVVCPDAFASTSFARPSRAERNKSLFSATPCQRSAPQCPACIMTVNAAYREYFSLVWRTVHTELNIVQ